MAFTTVFKRYETTYLISREQTARLTAEMAPYMTEDRYGKSVIRNIYFDTDGYRLIRRSIERPVYKEKLRIRSYSQVGRGGTVFVELKKKYKHVVYKRRVSMPESAAMAWVCGEAECPKEGQIPGEIAYLIKYYGRLRPTVFLSYEREAYVQRDGDLRITFDQKVLARLEDLSLCSPVYGEELLDDGVVLAEIKCSGGYPLWLTDFLSREKIYKTSFSKYGRAYQSMIYPKLYNRIGEKNDDRKYFQGNI